MTPQTSPTLQSMSAVSSPPSVATHDEYHVHAHRRIFIGPMPENVAALGDNDDSDDDNEHFSDERLLRFAREHAFRRFLQKGGNEEEWTEETERVVKEDMLKRWRDTARQWGRKTKWKGKGKKPAPTSKWIGGTFEVGDFMGVNVIQPLEEVAHSKASLSLKTDATSTTDAVTNVQTFVTAKSNLHVPSLDILSPTVPDGTKHLNVPNGNHGVDDSPRPSASSSTPLLRDTLSPFDGDSRPVPTREAKSDGDVHSAMPVRSILSPSDGQQAKGKGKGKAVHYENPIEEPAPPEVVLAREGDDIGESSAEAAAIAQDSDVTRRSNGEASDIFMRDRMLVRIAHCEHDSIGKVFDETHSRTTRGVEWEEWSEFMVVWRKLNVELYEDYSLPGKEWALGHKHLAFLIPLRDARTSISLFSPVDMTFCLMCRPTPVSSGSSRSKRHNIFHRNSHGTNIFVFKTKSRSRAIDWIWLLWNELGGNIPQSIDVYCPDLETRVTIPLPENSNPAAGLTRQRVIATCRHALNGLQNYQQLLEQPLANGGSLQLSWRTGTKLDWVWLEDDVEGKKRDWEVLYGLALKYPSRPTRLEIRLGEHYSTHITSHDGTRTQEPPAVEGYLSRIKPNSQTKTALYLASHDGYLFSLRPSHAHPPQPPGSISAIMAGSGDNDDVDEFDPSEFRAKEVRRSREQIMASDGYCDLRSIVGVRRAFQVVAQRDGPSTMTLNASLSNQTDGSGAALNGANSQRSLGTDGGMQGFTDEVEHLPSDDEDEGGDEGLAKATDKGHVRMRRSFELLMRSGHVVRLEANSRKVALEWISHLRELISYWTLRHRADARSEMELLHESTGRQRLTLARRVKHSEEDELPPEGPPDPDANVPYLSPYWNWCVLDACRPIIKSGRAFVKRGLRGQYKHMQLVLISGNLIQFHIVRRTHMHHHRSRTINLLDAYVCSGYFAALSLPRGEYRLDAPPTARIFQDGLETNDTDEDTLFMLWYHKHPTGHLPDETYNSAAVPTLSGKRKLLVCRARSMLERDAWCWALNCEIERVVRATKERESKARQDGEVVKL
ncbi:hypothetical protein BD410DRAFT_787507 [Rickenella mellea]|uniref:Uncharacterized protein n=1 Tax=Rickenella mellea TaxID=50990 RepID=A0A4Y7Q8G8_9AGAM|nr:hypothetical protein BD410DRAFT_787507 [Rickenella mellea]